MDLHKIDKKYPRRILDRLTIDHCSVKMVFDLPRKRHLCLTITLYPGKDEHVLEGSIIHLVTRSSRFEHNEVSWFVLAGAEQDTPRHLQEMMWLCIGDLDEHTYADGMIGHFLRQLVQSKSETGNVNANM